MSPHVRRRFVSIISRSMMDWKRIVFVVFALSICVGSTCLNRSIENIFNNQHFDCSTLPVDLRTKLALHLTFCHLNNTGIDSNQICSSPFDDTQQCLKNITANSFAYLTYTNFLPHVQSLCYALENQRWHRQTHQTIDQLHQHSNQIEIETRKLLEQQQFIDEHLDQTLRINQQSVDDALNVDQFLQIAQSDVEDLQGHLYVKDKAQIELIHQILETLSNIQSTLFTDAFGLSSYIFYILSLISIHLFTIPERTNDAKFWLILLWVGFIAIERYMLMFSSYSEILLYNALWRLRQFWLLVSCSLLAYYAVRYRNYARENQKLIDAIDRKHKQLEIAAKKCLSVIKKLEISDDSMNDDLLDDSMQNNEISSTATLTDEDDDL